MNTEHWWGIKETGSSEAGKIWRCAWMMGMVVGLALILSAINVPSEAAQVPSPMADSLQFVNTGTIYYVKSGAEGSCNSWTYACDLQDALGKANSGDQVWVARGIYYPGNLVADTFTLREGVTLYGGFSEKHGDWNQRDWIANPTILSADIDHNDLTAGSVVTDSVNIKGANAFHVVTIAYQASIVLDGFIITAGNANGSDYPFNDGGGLYNNAGNIILTNITFSGNTAYCGGGLTNVRGNVTLKDVTFTGNQALIGGGICNPSEGTVTLTGVVFDNNQADFSSGGLDNLGKVTLTDAIFSNNQAKYYAGGMFNNGGTVVLNNITFSNNSTTYYYNSAGGGMVNANNGVAVLTNVTFSGNLSYTNGGGMHNSGAAAILEDVTFSENDIMVGGGGMANLGGPVELTDVIFSDNHAGGMGGGLFEQDATYTTTLTNVIFTDNYAAQAGGGIHSYGSSPILTNVTFSANQTQGQGGGMYIRSGAPKLINITFSANSAGLGAGIGTHGSSPVLTNVTFSGNSADYGSGMHNSKSSPTLTNVTFFSNSATQSGGGIYNVQYEGVGSHPILTNSILWGNSPDQIYSDGISSITITYSDIEGGWPGASNIDLDPLLGPLADNDGFTLTHALREGSPAIDAGSLVVCPSTDQRSWPRPMDGDQDGTSLCDMGAYEFMPMHYRIYFPQVMK